MNKVIKGIAIVTMAMMPMVACNNANDADQSTASATEGNNDVTIITKADYDKAIAADENVLIDFYATWCGPCKQLEPNIIALQKQYGGKLKIYRIDVDKAGSLAESMNVSSIPHLIYYKKGQVKKEVLGYQSAEQLQGDASTIFSLN